MTYTIGSLNGRRSKRKETDVQSMIGESGWMEEFDGNEDADEEDEAHFDGTSNGNVSKQNDRNEEEAASLYSNMTRMTLSGIGYKGRPAPPPPAAQPLPPQLPPQPAFTNISHQLPPLLLLLHQTRPTRPLPTSQHTTSPSPSPPSDPPPIPHSPSPPQPPSSPSKNPPNSVPSQAGSCMAYVYDMAGELEGTKRRGWEFCKGF